MRFKIGDKVEFEQNHKTYKGVIVEKQKHNTKTFYKIEFDNNSKFYLFDNTEPERYIWLAERAIIKDGVKPKAYDWDRTAKKEQMEIQRVQEGIEYFLLWLGD